MYPEALRTLEKILHANGPELLVIGSRIGTQEAHLSLPHLVKNASPGPGKLFETLLEILVAAIIGHKIDIAERMRHFMQAHIVAIGIVGKSPEEIVPRK